MLLFHNKKKFKIETRNSDITVTVSLLKKMVTRSYLQLIVRSVNVARVVASVVISVLSILVYYRAYFALE